MQQKWEQGSISKSIAVVKPLSSIQFGKGCQYTSEAKACFLPQRSEKGLNDGSNEFKRKFLQNNVYFKGANRQDAMQTVAMANDGAKNQDYNRNIVSSNTVPIGEFGR